MKKILIVDDEAQIRTLVSRSIEGEGYAISEAANGAEALQKAQEIKPDLVILDLMMPDMWGYDVCEKLKNNPDTSQIRVLFLTGRGSLPSKNVGERKGGDDYIVKPFIPAELKKKVRILLELK